MVKVLVIGATGFIGGAVVYALRQNNHHVYGLARTPEKAKVLTQKDVIVIPGSASDSAAYLKIFDQHGIDAVIDLTGDHTGTYKILDDLALVAKNRLKTRGSKIGFLYVSGVWVHGSSIDPINDLDVIGRNAPNPPADFVSWRTDLEAKILASRNLFDVAIVRPGIIYGTTSPIWNYVFNPIYQAVECGEGNAEVRIEINPGLAVNLVHNDDIGIAIQLALEKLAIISSSGIYPIFDIVSSYESAELIIQRAAKALGFTGKLNFVPPSEGNIFGKGFNTSVNTRSDRAISLLGWRPTRYSMLADVTIYATSWKASQE